MKVMGVIQVYTLVAGLFEICKNIENQLKFNEIDHIFLHM